MQKVTTHVVASILFVGVVTALVSLCVAGMMWGAQTASAIGDFLVWVPWFWVVVGAFALFIIAIAYSSIYEFVVWRQQAPERAAALKRRQDAFRENEKRKSRDYAICVDRQGKWSDYGGCQCYTHIEPRCRPLVKGV